jgi:hypothetical protein
MRIRYIGQDGRTRIAEATRVKFMSDGWKQRDKRYEIDEDITGPVIVAHVVRSGGGKSLVMPVTSGFDMEVAKQQLLEKGWIDLSACPVKVENLY